MYMLTRTVESKTNIKKKNKMFTFTEVFPINSPAIPRLHLYAFFVGSNNANEEKPNISSIGGKLAYRLHKVLGGHWINISNNLISDKLVNEKDIKDYIDKTNDEDGKLLPFKDITGIEREKYWKPSPKTIADFTARSLLNDREIRDRLNKILSLYTVSTSDVTISRRLKIKGCEVDNLPALSLSLRPKIIHNNDLKTFIKLKHIHNPNDLIGLKVADKNTAYEGIINGVIGKIGEGNHRDKLSSLSQVEETKELISNADDDELIVTVNKKDSEYHYVLSSLNVVVREEDFESFDIDPKEMMPHLRLDESDRIQIIKDLSKAIKETGIIKEHSFNSKEHHRLFPLIDKDFDPTITLNFDVDNTGFTISSTEDLKIMMLSKLRENYSQGQHHTTSNAVLSLNISIINAIDNTNAVNQFLANLKDTADYLGIELTYAEEYRLSSITERSIQKTLYRCRKDATDIILTILPDNQDYQYVHYMKRSRKENHLITERNIRRTGDNKYIETLNSILLALLLRTKKSPFTMTSEATKTFDYIVLLDLKEKKGDKHQIKENKKFVMLNAQLFQSNGKYVRELAKDIVIDNSKDLPDYLLRSLLPKNTFAYKRTLIINSGYLKARYKKILKKWSYKIKCDFSFMYLINEDIPRIYSKLNDDYLTNTDRIFKFNNHQAIVRQKLNLPLHNNDYPSSQSNDYVKIRVEYPHTITSAINMLPLLSFIRSCLRF
jgi:hypothetical protein